MTDEINHRGNVRERVLEQDHVQLHGFQADVEGLLDPPEDGGELSLPDVAERLRVEGIDRNIPALQARRPKPLRAGGEHRAVRRHRDIGDVADRAADDLLHVEADKGLPAGVLHTPDPELPRDLDDPLDLVHGHLVLVRGAGAGHRPEALVVAIDAPEVAPLRDADPDVRDLAAECVHEHARGGKARQDSSSCRPPATFRAGPCTAVSRATRRDRTFIYWAVVHRPSTIRLTSRARRNFPTRLATQGLCATTTTT